jgi:hypothetical protein
MALAVPLRYLGEAQERWILAVENGTKYQVPRSEVEIDVWKVKDAMPSTLLGTNDVLRHAFDFFFKAIKSSQYAVDNNIALEFPYHSLGGNARLTWNDHPTERLQLQWDLVKEICEDDDLVEIEIEQLGGTEKEALRESAFHPNRIHTFLVILDSTTTFGYCLPASKLSSDYWSSEQFVNIPASKVAEFRFTTTEPDWFADLHRRIISSNAQSEKSEHVFPENAVPGDYTITEEDEHGVDDPPSEHELSRYPWWKIERWNRRAAHTGWGVYIPLGIECKFATVVWMGYRWSVEDKTRYFTTQQLPVSFHRGDVERGTSILLIRVLLAHATSLDFAPTVSGWDLENERFPCLYYVDCGTYRTKHIQRSGLLFPPEFIDRKFLKKQHAELISKRVITGPGGVRKIGDAARAKEAASYVANLQHCLRGPISGFHVREGKEFDDAIVQFAADHVYCHKHLTWFGDGGSDLTATLEYVILARELWQALADDWIPGGIIKIPVRDARQPK